MRYGLYIYLFDSKLTNDNPIAIKVIKICHCRIFIRADDSVDSAVTLSRCTSLVTHKV